ncbi:CT20-domain-containing protein [Trichodelitschia bisporula]|uniref:CT20-domain-containing protein n=1 Tax=Trichodelitschia bisporula TaxID=703511 RepID=A0A6G1I1W2_9PEZI|nr:CT20-domain-containing protein [Trichodelitschia bisporula]
MPPRKRARVTPLTDTHKTTSNTTTAAPAAPTPTTQATADILTDPWTDDEEILLFKSMIRWKPTGVHKHFRMLAISNALSSHGYTAASSPHTRIPGIWAKLRSLYDLDALDERENRHAGMETPRGGSPTGETSAAPGFFTLKRAADEDPDAPPRSPPPFALPNDEFADVLWARRFKSRSRSPPAIEGLNTTQPEPGVVLKGAEEEKIATRGRGRGRSTRSTPAEEEASAESEEEGTASPAPKAVRGRKPARGGRRGRKRG